MKKRALSLFMAVMLAAVPAAPAQAKTVSSAKAEHVFFYAGDTGGTDVLVKVLSLEELKELSHGAPDGGNYCYSATDNYPTTQYTEARGFTIPELVDYVGRSSAVPGAESLTFSSEDRIALMATDSYGSYTRSWGYDELYGTRRYYFEGLYGPQGWNTGWETADESGSKFGLTLEEYQALYQSGDSYYSDKRAAFASGQETEAILAVESFSGRTTSGALVASTEPGIAGYITENGGTVAGCLADALTEDCALRLCIPMSEADLMAGHRTAYDNFKWIYNLKLEMASPAVRSGGTVAPPQASFRLSGETLTIQLSCATAGASIYYAWDGAPQTLYTGPITYDVTGRDLNSDPVTLYMAAVREGYSDAGVVSARYPDPGVRFQTLYTAMADQPLTFTADPGVSGTEWDAWVKSSLGISMKAPSGTTYQALDRSMYQWGDRTVTFDASLFAAPGSCSFLFYAKGFANKNVSVTIKKAAPEVETAECYAAGGPITLTFPDAGYQNGLSIYVTPPGETASYLISSSYLDRSTGRQVTIRADYAALETGKIRTGGAYRLTLTNSGYSPSAQTVDITVREGFADVPPDAWYSGAVAYAAEQGLFSGVGGGRFAPEGTMTRAMFASVFHRYAGSPEAPGTASFTDVPAGEWYSESVNWAAAEGVLSGTGGGYFSPGGEITLEQMAAVLCRYAGGTAEGEAPGGYGPVSGWAAGAMEWARSAGLFEGVGGTLRAQAPATRAQVAAIMMRFAGLPGQ